jgi:hypothetical protein
MNVLEQYSQLLAERGYRSDVSQQAAVERLQRLSSFIKRNDHRLIALVLTEEQVALRQRFDKIKSLLLRRFQARNRRIALAFAIQTRHAARAINQQYMLAAAKRFAPEERLRNCKQDSSEREQLQKQQQIAPQLLERCVGLQVLDSLLPQQRRADLKVAPPQLEEVQNDERRNRDSSDDASE